MLAYTKSTEINLYNRMFFSLSCFSNITSHIFTFIISPSLFLVGSAFALLNAYLMIENRIKTYTESEYNLRYSIKIITGMIMITCSVFYINKDYVIYLPILMGIMYLNVNTIIKSKWVENVVILFMGAPFIKVAMYESTRRFEYFAVLFVFVSLAYMANMLFHSNKKKLEEYESRANSIKEIHKLMHHLTCHDVRNELSKLTCLQQSKYRKDIDLFQETMYGYIESINKLVDTKVLDNHESINLQDIIENLNHITNRNVVDFYYERIDPCPILSNRNFLFSTIKNFIENSMEAALNHSEKRFVKISQVRNIITIEDNCGGFDIKNIKTTKHDNTLHGVFLRTIIDPAIKNLFNFQVKIIRVHNGTRVELIFTE